MIWLRSGKKKTTYENPVVVVPVNVIFFFFDKECDLNKGERSVHSIYVYTLACKVVFGPIKLPSNSTLAYINKLIS